MSICIYSHEDGSYCDKHDHGAVTVGCCGEESCPDRKVLTNADRIRGMTDKELCEFLLNRDMQIVERASKVAGFNYYYDESQCIQNILDWLKSPVDGDY